MIQTKRPCPGRNQNRAQSINCPDLDPNKTEAHSRGVTLNFIKKLSPKQNFLLKILLGNPAGVLSHELRRKCRVMNIHHLIRQLRQRGLVIHCEMEPFRNEFDEAGSIGRIRLASESRELARDLMGVN